MKSGQYLTIEYTPQPTTHPKQVIQSISGDLQQPPPIQITSNQPTKLLEATVINNNTQDPKFDVTTTSLSSSSSTMTNEMEVVVPQGAGGGDVLTVKSPNGQILHVFVILVAK